MKKGSIYLFSLAILVAGSAAPLLVSAHEAYVLPHALFWAKLSSPSTINPWDAWKNPHNVAITLSAMVGVLIALGVNFWLRTTAIGNALHRGIEKLAPAGPFIVRLTIAASFFMSASSHSFLGPEMPLNTLPYATFFRIALYAISFMIAFGFLTELAALLGIILFLIAGQIYGSYLLTYTNYIGELIVLLIFGMRRFSIDTYLLGPLKKHLHVFEKYETSIVRIFYGFALLYAAITVKFLHPDIAIEVVRDWNLTQFHWLFPSDPLLIALGAALAETVIGLFIIIGFELRFTVLITLFYITLSLFYFKEAVWPHYLLYGISLNLLIQPEIFTLDHFIFKHLRRRLWHRPFKAHRPHGKSYLAK